jgi:two-component system probable response regulator PhcQ
MENSYDYKKHAILYVDDEEKSLKHFARAFEGEFRIFTATSAQAGLKLLEEHRDEIGLLMTDQRMPGEKGVWLLERARQLRPRIIRVLATGYADMDAAIAAVNTGAIYKYITKPWDPPQLETTLKRGLEFFLVQKERDQLLQEKMSVLHNMMIADRLVSLGLLATGLSHHIRNSLQAVRTFVDLAPAKLEEEKVDVKGLRNPDFWKDYYQNVQSQITKINTLLSDLCVASHTPDFQFGDRVNLRTVIEEVVGTLKGQLAQKNIIIENQIPETLPPLQVDRAKFYRLFELLLRDEAATLQDGGKVGFTAQEMSAVQGQAPGLEIQMSDNGPGLPKEALRLVFDPFVVRSDTPLEYGIHLMGCYFIVHHHGGSIEANNQNGQGTVFTIRFPFDPYSAAPKPDRQDFLQKVLLNQTIWEKLISAD